MIKSVLTFLFFVTILSFTVAAHVVAGKREMVERMTEIHAHNSRRSLDNLNSEILKGISDLASNEEVEKEEHADDDRYRKQEAPKPRTATGGVINTVMIFLTILAFVGNAAFLVYIFWLKENITFSVAKPKAFLPFNNLGMGPADDDEHYS